MKPFDDMHAWVSRSAAAWTVFSSRRRSLAVDRSNIPLPVAEGEVPVHSSSFGGSVPASDEPQEINIKIEKAAAIHRKRKRCDIFSATAVFVRASLILRETVGRHVLVRVLPKVPRRNNVIRSTDRAVGHIVACKLIPRVGVDNILPETEISAWAIGHSSLRLSRNQCDRSSLAIPANRLDPRAAKIPHGSACVTRNNFRNRCSR